MMRANSFDAAFERSLSIGRKHDDDYTNEDGERVRWRFLEVITLDVIAEDDLDGVEIYSEPQPDDGNSNLRFETEFSPETSRPTQTI